MSHDSSGSEVKNESIGNGNSANGAPLPLGFSEVDTEPEAKKMEMAKADLLREFDILDEFGDESEENAENTSSCSSYVEDDMEQHSDWKDESEEDKNNLQDSKSKSVFDVYDLDSNQPLPPGWVKVVHDSGIPVYLHKESRVCMATRPYYLGADSVRKHKIPASCVPCLDYAKLKAEYLTDSTAENVGNKAESLLSSEMLSHYCNKLFRFKTIRVMRFNTWADRRLYTKNRMLAKQGPNSELPVGAKIVNIPVDESNDPTSESKDLKKKSWVLNPNGKSCVCLLHEYVQHALKKHPSYVFSELENAKTPYLAAVVIDGMQYGVGFGSSKKQAKLEAAKATLEVLIPDLQDKISTDSITGHVNTGKQRKAENSIFDDIRIEDPRVAELCARTTEPYPHAVLLACIKRNFGLEESDIKYEDRSLSEGEHEFTIRVADYCAVVRCHNKRDGKQRTAQAILKQLHPHIVSWGSLLRMYGNCSVKSIKKKREKKREQIYIEASEPERQENISILSRLKAVMTGAEASNTELPQYCQRIKEIEELIKQKCQTSAMETAPSCLEWKGLLPTQTVQTI
ncbi:microprocessor complex subunit DGCR8-like isoform X2 [Bacillus rossius redtenbacheri]|uniref:microprocessor complex subunit DGCR8-like isoform X2 n=1 Tax=Bacillus rossius redtenbacheri TaxID=93214 RepID=UPI002FDD1CEA